MCANFYLIIKLKLKDILFSFLPNLALIFYFFAILRHQSRSFLGHVILQSAPKFRNLSSGLGWSKQITKVNKKLLSFFIQSFTLTLSHKTFLSGNCTGLQYYRFEPRGSPTLVAQDVSACLTGHILQALPPQGELKE